jgi:hypothetical protein
MPIGATIGAAVVGAGASIYSGNKAAKSQTNAANQQVGEQRRQYDQSRADLAPWRTTGGSALAKLSQLYGLDGQAPDASVFTASPGYQFRFNEGQRAIDRGAAARGLLHSGAAVKAEQNFGQGLASQEFGNFTNTLMGIAGTGQQATNTTVAAGQNAANNISQAYGQAGNARASSYANTGSAINSGINNVLFSYLNGFGGQQAPNYGKGY